MDFHRKWMNMYKKERKLSTDERQNGRKIKENVSSIIDIKQEFVETMKISQNG